MEVSFTLLVGIGLMTLGVPWIWSAHRAQNEFVRQMGRRKLVEGVVTRQRLVETYNHMSDLSQHDTHEVPMVEYTVNNIRYITPVRKSLEIGDKALIAYDPAVPSDGMLAESYAHYPIYSGAVILAVGAALIALALTGSLVLD
jgi:hypothetical protein